MGVCGGNLREGRRTHSGQQELEGTSSDSEVMSVILTRGKSVLDNKKSNWKISTRGWMSQP